MASYKNPQTSHNQFANALNWKPENSLQTYKNPEIVNFESRKENYEEKQDKKLEEDIQSTKSFRGLIQIIKELKSPSVSIEKPATRVISSYAFNQIRKSFVFGFNNGEVSYWYSNQANLLKTWRYI